MKRISAVPIGTYLFNHISPGHKWLGYFHRTAKISRHAASSFLKFPFDLASI